MRVLSVAEALPLALLAPRPGISSRSPAVKWLLLLKPLAAESAGIETP
jgi:hypothetical protein